MSFPITDKQWRAYYLWHSDYQPDRQKKTIGAVADEMGVTPDEVREMLETIRRIEPSLFKDISSDGRRPEGRRGVSRYGGWCDGNVKRRF